jgi:hypothetical protein
MVSAETDPDLFWALRGAGHNFGIITSITARAFPELNGGEHYLALLAFPPPLIEQAVSAINGLKIEPDMYMNILFTRPPPEFRQEIMAVALWHPGSQESARQKYAPLFALQPMVVQEAMTPYDCLNDGVDPLLFKG